tara:strand:+ start:1579 stop:2283 length:705 start_codon:yes stop_codon:yes gene_type:complete
MQFSKKNYIKLINTFKNQGYSFKDYSNFHLTKNIILRHDVDFYLEAAEELAKIEYKENVKSNFFFMISNNFYNITSKYSQGIIKNIKKLGHNISLHYDHKNHYNINKGLKLEKNLFEDIFNLKIKIISIHRPGNFITKSRRFKSTRHTYEKPYFKKIGYYSDSRGSFRYGNPTESKEFKDKKTIQLLIHPIWWVARGNTPSEKIKYWVQNKLHFFQREIILNNKAYNKRKLILK